MEQNEAAEYDSDVSIDAFNIEGRYLDRALMFIEEKLDVALEAFLSNPSEKEFHVLGKYIVILIGKLARSAKIKDDFFKEMDAELKEIANEYEQAAEPPANHLLRLLNRINRQISHASMFTKPSLSTVPIRREGPTKVKRHKKNVEVMIPDAPAI